MLRGTSARLVFLSAVLLLAGACAFTPPNQPTINEGDGKQSRTFQLPAKELYKVAWTTAQNMGYQVWLGDPGQGIIRTDLKPAVTHGNCECGDWHGVPVQGNVDSCLFIKVTPRGQGSADLTVSAHYSTRFIARNGYGMITRDDTYRCGSKGGLEKIYLSSLASLAAHWAPSKNSSAMTATPPEVPPVSKEYLEAQKRRERMSYDATNEGEVEHPKLAMYKARLACGLINQREYAAWKKYLETQPY